MSANVINNEERAALASRVGLVKKRKAEPEVPRISTLVCTHRFYVVSDTDTLYLGQVIYQSSTTINPHKWHLHLSPHSTQLFSIAITLTTRGQAQARRGVRAHEILEQEDQGMLA